MKANKPTKVIFLYVLAAFQITIALSSIYLTSQNSIAASSCLVGIFGIQVNALIFLCMLAWLIFTVITWRSKPDNRIMLSPLLIILGTSALATFIHIRSAMLCTV